MKKFLFLVAALLFVSFTSAQQQVVLPSEPKSPCVKYCEENQLPEGWHLVANSDTSLPRCRGNVQNFFASESVSATLKAAEDLAKNYCQDLENCAGVNRNLLNNRFCLCAVAI